MKMKGFFALVIVGGFLGGLFFMNTGQALAEKGDLSAEVKISAAKNPVQKATQVAMEKSAKSHVEAHVQLHRSLSEFSRQMRENRRGSKAKLFVKRIPENLLRS